MQPQDTPSTKICTMCGEEKPHDQFYLKYDKKHPHRRQGYCKKCKHIVDAAKEGKLPTGPMLEKYESWKQHRVIWEKLTPEEEAGSRRRARRRRRETDGYRREKQRHRASRLARAQALKVDMMRGGCIACGESEIACLDFHHLDPSVKEGAPPSLLKAGSFSRAVEEAAKCVVLCANCHRKLHAGIITLS